MYSWLRNGPDLGKELLNMKWENVSSCFEVYYSSMIIGPKFRQGWSDNVLFLGVIPLLWIYLVFQGM